MSLITEQGSEQILQVIKNNTTWYCQLYTSPSGTPSSEDVLANYTLATFDGGTYVALNNWSNTSNNSERGQMSHPSVSWTATDDTNLPQTCYGYVVYDSSGNLIWVSKFDTPQTISNVNDFVSVNIVLQMFDFTLA